MMKQALCHHTTARRELSTLLSERFYWKGTTKQIENFIKHTRVNPAAELVRPRTASVKVPYRSMRKVGRPRVMVTSQWWFAWTTQGKISMPHLCMAKLLILLPNFSGQASYVSMIVLKLLYRIRGEFGGGGLSNKLPGLTGVKQKVTSAYHPQKKFNFILVFNHYYICEFLVEWCDGTIESFARGIAC